jgi:predicted AAA+ superfamily ATPase
MLYRAISKQIIEDLSYFSVVAIIGPRQVGKTTLVKELRTQLNIDSIYLDLELESDSKKLEDAENFLKNYQDKCVIIDEVQKMPSLFPLLRALVDSNRRPARYILLGSASPDIIKNSSETLAGRIAYNELMPFSLLEIPNSIEITKHWFRGGFPSSLLAPTDTLSKRWLEQFIITFIERDLQNMGYQVQINQVRNLIQMLAGLSGNLLNIADLSRSLGVANQTIKKYLSLLEGSFLVNILQPYYTNISKRIIKSHKIYIRDSGILHSLNKISDYDAINGSHTVGTSWEGYVIEQIKRVCSSSNNGNWQYYFYRTQKGAEIDLLLISPTGKKIAIEIKYSLKPNISRGFFEAIDDIKSDANFVITPQTDKYSHKNIQVYGIKLFLEELPNLQNFRK